MDKYCVVWVNLDNPKHQGQGKPTDLASAQAWAEEMNKKHPRYLHKVAAYPPSLAR